MDKVRKIVILLLLLSVLLSFFGCRNNKDDYDTIITDNKNLSLPDIDTGGININFRAADKYIYAKKKKNWNAVFLKGVNIGLTEATTDLNNPNVSYDTYLDWFNKIGKMNANTIKVFSIMNPNFYQALSDYNKTNKSSPLYLIQGIWFNENYLYDIGDALDKDKTVINSFKKAVTETVDIIHGNSKDTVYGEWSPAIYNNDVSKYVSGYVLGLEWPAEFVVTTNDKHKGKSYSGKYLYTDKNASPFEAFLADVGDSLISFETSGYKHQTPVAFLNWSTTDPLEHTNEPFPEEDQVGVNTENILSKKGYFAGQFAAIDIYPYYPEFINYQEEYTSYVDESGKKNPYRAYIKDLRSKYKVPVIVAEFGVPTSRGKAHNSIMGYNQGGITEQQQGQYISEMINDIFSEQYGGAIIFSWQDEWFKQTWNTIKYAPENPAMRTVNMQSAEQHYGILAYEPGTTAVCNIDGDFSEWGNSEVIASQDGYDLYSKYDEGYLYLYIKSNTDIINSSKKVYIPIKTLGIGSKSYKAEKIFFSDSTDYLLQLNGKDNSRLLTDAYNDIFNYVYTTQKKVFPESYSPQNSGVYNPVNMFLSNEIVLPVSNKTIPPVKYESGKLVFGNSNPTADNYNSLADFYSNENGVEIRISWYNLGIMNSAEMVSVDDCHKRGDVRFKKIEDIKMGIGVNSNTQVSLVSIKYNGIKTVTFHSRLKKSYDIIKEKLSTIK